MAKRLKARTEFGDFQTPLSLAREVCALLRSRGCNPASILEPTCGKGAFLKAATEEFPDTDVVWGFDRNDEYVHAAKAALRGAANRTVKVRQGDFFDVDWTAIVARLPDPILVLGNPPWVTNSALGTLRSGNLPKKGNVDNLRGIDALTGKSNFDISEWMLRENIRWLARRYGTLAVLCKTVVARKVLAFAWSRRLPLHSARLYRLDAKTHFGAAVDACLFVVQIGPREASQEASVFDSLHTTSPALDFGLRDGELVADVRLYERWRHLKRKNLGGWRSGVKHDCSAVFELEPRNGGFTNALGEHVAIERDVVFPLLKSSDLAAHRMPRKWLLVPHRSMSESPESLAASAPEAWSYLLRHSELIKKRGSSIYRGKPPFTIFGVGTYTFAPYKVAISGLYKQLDFRIIGRFHSKPVVFDDTCYLFPCVSRREAELLSRLVRSRPAMELWSALVFWDAKRPITAKLLSSLDLASLARETGEQGDLVDMLVERQLVEYSGKRQQRLLFRTG